MQLPPDASGELATAEARRCDGCGYHYAVKPGADKCTMCGEELYGKRTGLLHLHTVYTTPRERISSDEEERRRAGFRLETSYAFQDHGARKGRLTSHATDANEAPVLTLDYGDSATVRITNLGRVRAKEGEPDGYWLDLGDGRWLNDRAAATPSRAPACRWSTRTATRSAARSGCCPSSRTAATSWWSPSTNRCPSRWRCPS
ncbi:hypothetical protein LV779_14635 [Streptomyces thinghirensis]|nr:hypothetical protein [Streptomyces thinghirensis]